jgi:predicted secreted protein
VLRGKRIIYVAHCVLNQNSVIRDWERAKGALNNIVKILLENDIAIVQLPCPEFTYLGESRPPKTKEEYNTQEYRKLCQQLGSSVTTQIKEYINNDYNIIGLLGIKGSPSCDTLGMKGVFMEELFEILRSEGIELNTFDIPEDYIEGQATSFIKELKSWDCFLKLTQDKMMKY